MKLKPEVKPEKRGYPGRKSYIGAGIAGIIISAGIALVTATPNHPPVDTSKLTVKPPPGSYVLEEDVATLQDKGRITIETILTGERIMGRVPSPRKNIEKPIIIKDGSGAR